MKKKDLRFIAEDTMDDLWIFSPFTMIAGAIFTAISVGVGRLALIRHFFDGSVLNLADAYAQWLTSLSIGQTILFYSSAFFGIILIFVIISALLLGLVWLITFITRVIKK